MSNVAGAGQRFPFDAYGDFNAVSFLVRQLIAEISTMTPVKVVACSNSGGVSPVGTVDVQPLVSFLDGNGNATKHGVLRSVPYFRLQGGTNAIIIDPVVGDVGYCMFADQDISAVVAAKGAANPGSLRKFDMSDGIYVGGVLNGAPTNYIQFQSNGSIVIQRSDGAFIEMGPSGGVSMNGVAGSSVIVDQGGVAGIVLTPGAGGTISLGNVDFVGTVTGTGGTINLGSTNLTTSGQVTAGGKALSTHVHTGVTTGSGDTGPPA